MAPVRRGGTVLHPKGFAEVRKGDGTVLYSSDSGSSTPDSAFAHYDATELDLSDSDSVDRWPDLIGDRDLTGSNLTYQDGVINTNPGVVFDGADDILNYSFDSDVSQPFTVFQVLRSDGSNNREEFFTSTDGDVRVQYQFDNNQWVKLAPDTVVGGSYGSGNIVLTSIWDGGNSSLRINGSVEISGDSGSNPLPGIHLGSDSNGGNYFGGPHGELVVCDDRVSEDELGGFEADLMEKWGI